MIGEKLYLVALFLLFLTACSVLPAKTYPNRPGLSVYDGVLIQSGKPYYGIGANYFTMFNRTLKEPSDKSYRTGLALLSNAGIPFVRFMCSGYWPIDWDLYLQDKKAYWKILDDIVKTAEVNHIGLIPSLFWYMPTVPDIVGEPIDQLGNSNSKANGFIRQYTKEIVLRYKESPAIWGWEFGNEYNLYTDLPNPEKYRPPVRPKLKTALRRTQRDALSSTHMLVAFNEFARTVRKYDTQRIIITGNAVPRPSAFHNTHMGTWERDTEEQFGEILLRDNPDPFNIISVHVYPNENQRYPARANDLESLITTIQDISSQAKKPIFIGEFGVPRTLGAIQERAVFEELLTAIEDNQVPLSAFWVFDWPAQDHSLNVTFRNDRAYMIKLVAEANSRLKASFTQMQSSDHRRFHVLSLR